MVRRNRNFRVILFLSLSNTFATVGNTVITVQPYQGAPTIVTVNHYNNEEGEETFSIFQFNLEPSGEYPGSETELNGFILFIMPFELPEVWNMPLDGDVVVYELFHSYVVRIVTANDPAY